MNGFNACTFAANDLGHTGIEARTHSINSLAPGRPECNSKNVIFNLVLLIGIFRSSHDNTLRWMTQDLTDDKSTLVQVMAWCCEATSHYLSQCWLSSVSPYGVAGPQWVKGFMSLWKKNSLNLNYNYNNAIRSQICTCHVSSAAVACAKLRTDLINIYEMGPVFQLQLQ